MTNLIVRNDSALEASITPDAVTARDDAIICSALFAKVDDANHSEAVLALEGLAKISRATEKARKEVKEPVLNFGRKIDDCAKQYLAPLTQEYDRLVRLVTDHVALQELRKRELENRQRREMEAAEKERSLALAAAKTIEQVDAIQKDFCDKAREQQSLQIVVPKPEGQVVREEWQFEIADPLALANAFPDCVDITPRRGRIKERLESGGKLPGVKAWKELKVSVRSTK